LGKEYLIVRLWPFSVECQQLRNLHPGNVKQIFDDSVAKASLERVETGNRKVDRFADLHSFHNSAAAMICQMVGFLPCEDTRLTDRASHHEGLFSLLNLPLKDRNPEAMKQFKKLALKALKDLLSIVDMVFCTTTVAADRPCKEFVSRAGLITKDEAGSSLDSELAMIWVDPDRQLCMLIGDEVQLPSPVFSLRAKDKNGRRVNAHAPTLATSTMQRLQLLGWPVYLQPEQLWMPDGQFDPANYVSYNDRIAISDLCSPIKYPENSRRRLQLTNG
jgi:hypothetical protein